MNKYIVERKEANRGVVGQWEVWARTSREACDKAEQMYGRPPCDFAYSATLAQYRKGSEADD